MPAPPTAPLQHAALMTSTLLSKVLAAPNIKLFNATAGERHLAGASWQGSGAARCSRWLGGS